MRKYFFNSMLMAVVWMFVSGTISIASMITGLILGLAITYVFRDFYTGEFNISDLKKTPHVLKYLLVFGKALVVSNLEVAYRIIKPSMPVDPGIFEYDTDLKNPTAVTVLANSITLTPGTLVIDYSEENDKLLIHCLNLQNEGEEKEGIRKWEKILKQIFGDKE